MHGLAAAGRTSCALLASGCRSGGHLVHRDYLPLEGGAAPPRPRSHLSRQRIGRSVLAEEVSSFICV
jgi:hypothetical protein